MSDAMKRKDPKKKKEFRIQKVVPDEFRWELTGLAPPGYFLLFAYVSKTSSEPNYLKALIVFENETHYKLVAGIGITKLIKKDDIFKAMVFPVRERN